MPKKKKANDFTIQQDACNGLSLTIRCLSYSIFAEDDLTEADLEMFERIEQVLNQNAKWILDEKK